MVGNPQAQEFVELIKPKQNRVKSKKNDFLEIYLLNLLRSCVSVMQVFKNLYEEKYRCGR